MRRIVAIVAIASLLSGCATRERPEGIVERWLLALNQGEAGRPNRYALPTVSRQILPGYSRADPGEFDVVEVARAGQPVKVCEPGSWVVPFRIVHLDGSEVRSAACVRSGMIAQLTDRIGFTGPVFPSEGGRPVTSVSPSGWFLSFVIAVGLLLLCEAVMRLVPPRATR